MRATSGVGPELVGFQIFEINPKSGNPKSEIRNPEIEFVAAWSQRMVIAVQSTNACVALRNFTRSLTAAQVGVGGWVDWPLDRLG